MNTEYDFIRSLVELMDERGLHEIDVRDEGRRVRLLKHPPPAAAAVAGPMVPEAMLQPAVEVAPAAPPRSLPADSEEPGVCTINSPMVGTFYRAPGPDEPAFVDVGNRVGEDTVVCIIEAMKVMNEIRAGCAGEVLRILVANGEAVEYGEPLFEIKVA